MKIGGRTANRPKKLNFERRVWMKQLRINFDKMPAQVLIVDNFVGGRHES